MYSYLKQSVPLVAGALVLAGCFLFVCGCHSQRVDRNTAYAPGALENQSDSNGIPLDEQYRLRLLAEDVLQLEQVPNYQQLYRHYASRSLRRTISQRDFLKISQCVAYFLGEILKYDLANAVFKPSPSGVLVIVPVMRASGKIHEHLFFIHEGIDFKLNGIYWSTKNGPFRQCITHVLTPEKQASPKPAQSKPTPSLQTPPQGKPSPKQSSKQTSKR